ncbi:RagB/SusD family nutrient uptake outer membrane protein [Membranihabitans maritimus]|uniref:RagB/SusD family nutrient uptake outer membrane protein n=1 Tax=Membranihabitans maritimus TaxID=2904244 RepID=UPI001F3F62D2|nr:RagB/SusD family nutrient uptake outer membrane protein [Membranihabitans maritimus]
MKTLTKIGILIFTMFSCQNKLDLIPISSKTDSGFYITSEHIEQALAGCYDALQEAKVNQNFSYMLTEARSDNTWQTTFYDDGQFCRFSEDALNTTLATAWNNLYNYINRCNRVIYYVGEIDAQESSKNQWKGEALFIRSLLYFDLVRIFGEVPIVIEPLTIDDAYEVPKSTIQEVYDVIKNDLSEIVNNNWLSTEIFPGRANIYAAKALLGKVLIYRSGYPLRTNEWSQAKLLFEDVIGSGEFEFFENYDDIFAFENENAGQSLFAIKFVDGTNEGNSFPSRNAPNEIDPSDFVFGGTPFRLHITEDIAKEIFPATNDFRKQSALRMSWLNKSGDTITNDPWCRKYSEYKDQINGPVSGLNNWNIDFILIRFTDVMMLYAEALNELEGPNGEALAILNRVRARAGLEPNPQTDKETFRLWMEQERRSEFCFENERWFDLVRTDRALDVMQAFLERQGGTFVNNFTDRSKYYYPIPQSVTDLTGIK